jgi:hypothetical protein
MSKTNYSGSIALTKLVSVEMTKNGKDGQPVKGIFIPYSKNYITEKDGAAYLNINVVLHDAPDQYKNDGFISQKLDSETYKSMGKEAANALKLPILGNVRNFATGGNSNDSAGKAADISENDDLPW